MDIPDRFALLLIIAGIFVVFLGIALFMPEIQQTSITGGAVIFIGPIPIFFGWGAPAEVIFLLILLMLVLTMVGFILYKSAKSCLST